MSVEIKVPALGESIVEATVGEWLKHEGEAVAANELLVTLETDKVNLEVTANDAGVLQRILKQEGATVGIDETLAILGTASEGAADSAEVATASEAAPASAAAPASEPVATPAATQEQQGGAANRATPLARRIASEHGLDLQQVRGSGPAGRVTQEDVAAYLAHTEAPANGTLVSAPPNGHAAPAAPSMPAAPAPAQAPAPQAAAPSTPPPAPPTPASAQVSRGEERVRMSRRRQTIARRLVEAQHTAAMLTTFNEVDMSAVMELRKRRRDSFKERHGVSLGFMSFFTKAVVGALKAIPHLNAEIQGDEIVVKRYYDIGIAVSTDEGLVVPVLRDADRLSFAEIERQIAELAERARKGTLTLADLQGGTFTITNGGTFGSMLSTPILNGPQVGILGMHKIEERPIALNGQVVIHPMMYLAVSYDHRIVDGAQAVRFLVRVKELLEDPETLLLEG